MPQKIEYQKAKPNLVDDRDEKRDFMAALIERDGRRALAGFGRPSRNILECVPLPKFVNAPKGAKVIDRGSHCVALAHKGVFLGLFSTEP